MVKDFSFCKGFLSIFLQLPNIRRQAFEDGQSKDGQHEVEENKDEFRPNKKPLKKSSKTKLDVKKEWSHKETLRLIELWENEEVHYNIKHRGCSKKDQRHNGLQRVPVGLEECGNIVDLKEIGKFLHKEVNLRIQKNLDQVLMT